jgi:hypothetical protein
MNMPPVRKLSWILRLTVITNESMELDMIYEYCTDVDGKVVLVLNKVILRHEDV